MERIENVLQRIQELYFDKRQKASIDLDLMLDYTRVMYADLLEWRRNIRQNEIIPDNEKNETESNVSTEQQHEEEQHVPLEINAQPEEACPTMEDDRKETAGQDAKTSDGHGIDLEQEDVEDQEDDQKPEPEKTSADTPVSEGNAGEEKNEEKEHFVIRDRSVLSYEPPKVQEKMDEAPDQIVEGQGLEQGKPHRPVSPEIPFFTESRNKPTLKSKDIRKNIGLNDKYLFLNELFNNQRPAYDEALDKINSLSTLEAAKEYLNEEILEKYKWDKNDETVKDFYTVLGKHFSSK